MVRTQAGTARPGEPAGDTGQAQPGPAGRARRLAAAVRRHWLAAVLLTAGLLLRVLTQLAYRPALFYIDTTRYLYNVAPGMDPLGYKGVLRGILAVAGLGMVAAVQHLLGLAMAVTIYVLLLRRGVPRWLAALAMAPVLLDAYQLQIEQTLMPDTWFEALIVAGLAILLWQSGGGRSAGAGAERGRARSAGAGRTERGSGKGRARGREQHSETSWRRAVAAGAVLGTSAIFAQVGEALILPAAVYLLVAGGSWRRALGKAAALCLAFVLPILAYETGSYLLAGNFFLSHTGVTSMYGRAAAAADCATLRLPPAERRLPVPGARQPGMCPARALQAQGPDALEFNADSPIRAYYNRLPRAEVDSLISSFNHQVLAQQPLRVLGAYTRDVVRLFALTRDGSPGATPISRWQFQTAYPYYDPHASKQVIGAATARYGGGAPSAWRPAAAFLRAYQLGGGYTPGPLYLLCVVAGLAGSAALLRRRADRGTRQLAVACLLFFTAGVAVLAVSDLFEFSWRYQLPALVTLVPAGALGIAVVLRWIRGPAPVAAGAGTPATTAPPATR